MSTPRRALIVIDVQQEYFRDPLAVQYPPREDSLARIAGAMDVAEGAGVPVLTVQHEYPEGAPVFASGSPGWRLHPDIERRPSAKHVVKTLSSVFSADGVAEWLQAEGVDTVTLVGYMTNNCVLATAAAAEPLGFAVEVLSDATGAIHLANEAGRVSAQQVHETLMVLLQSNWAAVAGSDAWAAAVAEGRSLPASDLGTSAMQGR
ncbi:cysteine hydrolase family protein [Prauserella rugosa]|uniref:Nicotinamidase-related amidase n=1 Tax=Prauserella rugosa TaxID=43354 RepID=A0A660CH88_9PSEU|nr:cysteine hydrolase family protein [Prauserella rugosa]KMS89616.1 isochorismatase [Streptomyces regensis]TWH20401.1 nicotinamidase-related amidase [Prauserella rugosa]